MADQPTPPTTPASGFPPEAPFPAAPQTGLAVAALILGIAGLAFCPLTAIAALITGIIALVRCSANPERFGGRGMALAGLLCGGVSFILYPLLALLLMPGLLKFFDETTRNCCAQNLAAIHSAITDYRIEQPETELQTLRQLERDGYLSEDSLVCPAFMVFDPNYTLVRANIGREESNAVLVYEPKANHGGKGGHVLFADGRALFAVGEEYDKLVSSAKPTTGD